MTSSSETRSFPWMMDALVAPLRSCISKISEFIQTHSLIPSGSNYYENFFFLSFKTKTYLLIMPPRFWIVKNLPLSSVSFSVSHSLFSVADRLQSCSLRTFNYTLLHSRQGTNSRMRDNTKVPSQVKTREDSTVKISVQPAATQQVSQTPFHSSPFCWYNLRSGGVGLANLVSFNDFLRLVSCSFPGS